MVAELAVRLVDDDHRRLGRLGRLVQREYGLGVDGGAGGVVGRGDEDDVGPVLGDDLPGGLDVDGEVLVARSGDPAGAGTAGDEGVHGVRGLEADRGAPRAAEGLQQLLEHFVGAVGRPDVGEADLVSGGAAEVAGQLRTELDGVPVGVAVEVAGGLADPLGDPVDERLGQRVRVLVGVQPHGYVELRRPVRGLATQFVADRELVPGVAGGLTVRHCCGTSPPNLALSAAPWAGRSSASARVTTWWVTSASASRV